MHNSLTSVSALRGQGFDGHVAVADLRRGNGDKIPDALSVYLVLRDSASNPEFLETGTDGHFKGKDPNIPIARLVDEWVEGSMVVYVDQTGNKSKGTLKRRIGTVTRVGQGAAVGHWGGRLVWQLARADRLLFCWKEIADDDSRNVEKELIETFASTYGGRLPLRI